MIVFEIEKKNKPHPHIGVFRRPSVPNVSIDPVKAVIDAERVANQVRMAEGEKPEPRTPIWIPAAQQQMKDNTSGKDTWTGDTAISMGKLGYARWLSAFVYNQFKKGTYVTFRGEPYVPEAVPRIWFEVIEIQEIHYMANMDKSVREPKAIGVCPPGGPDRIPVWYAPAKLRVLQPEELKAIDNFRDQTQQRGASNPDGSGGDGSGNGNETIEQGPEKEGDI